MNNNQSFYNEEPIKLSYVLDILLRQKWTIVLTFITILGGVVIYTFMQQKKYEASTSIFVKDNEASQAINFLKTDETIDRIIQNELEVLQSKDLLEKVTQRIIDRAYNDTNTKKDTLPVILEAKEIGKTNDLHSGKFRGILMKIFADNMSLYYKENTNVIKFYYRSSEPEEASILANIFIDAYAERDLQGSRANVSELRNFLEEQNKLKNERLAKSDSALQKYMQSAGIKELDAQTSALTNRVASLESELESNQIEYKNTQLLLNKYKDELKRLGPSISQKLVDVDDLYITELQQVIAKKQAEKDLLKINSAIEGVGSQYSDQIQKLNNGLDSLKALLLARTRNYIKSSMSNYSIVDGKLDNKDYISQLSGEIQRLDTKLAALEQSKNILNDDLNKYESKLAATPKQSITLAKLQRERLFNEKLTLSIGEKYEEALLAEKSSFGKVQILDRASVPTDPVSPNVKMNILFGSLSGLTLGILLAFVLNLMFNKIHTPRDVEHLGFRLLSTIPRLKLESSGQTKLLTQGSNDGTQLITAKNPNSDIYESYLRLGVNIAYNFIDKNLNSLLVTSPGPGAGKSATAINLSITLANLGKSILLVDTDLRRPVIHKYFNKPMLPGLTEYLLEQKNIEQIIQPTLIKGLNIITCGGRFLNPSLILSSGRMRTFMELQNENYDFVIYDAPPLNVVTDAIHLAKNVDEVVMVVRSDKTYVDELERANDLLKQVNVNIGGIVLNDYDASKSPIAGSKFYGFYAYEEKETKKKFFKRRQQETIA